MIQDSHPFLSRKERRRKIPPQITSFVPYIPGLLSWDNKPLNTDDWRPFNPLYSTRTPPKITVRSGRGVGKSISIVARRLLLAAARPNTPAMVLCPLQNQSDRLSIEYFQPMLKQSPLGSLLREDGRSGNVRRVMFDNGSLVNFLYASTDASRVRGFHVVGLDLDECVPSYTRVSTPAGDVRVSDLKVGTTVVSFDSHGVLTTDVVTHVPFRGYRDCYQLEFSDGRTLDATSGEILPTTAGWKRLESVISEVADAVAGANGPRDHARRREPDTDLRDPGVVPVEPRVGTERVQLPEIRGVVRVRSIASREEGERRLRGVVQSLGDVRLRDTLPYRFLVLPRRQEASQPGVGRDRVGTVALVRISWVGRQRVYDVTTAKYHAFFANGVAVSNCQDISPEIIPILKECASRPNAVVAGFGTSKTQDTALEKAYRASTQSVWKVPCKACGYVATAAHEEAGGDLTAMIGPYRDDISEARPGTLCPKCRVPINPRYGWWEHRFPEFAKHHLGLHIPQPIMPFHFNQPAKWYDLDDKRKGGQGYSFGKFMNEVLGEPWDLAHRLVGENDLKRAGVLGPNTLEAAEARVLSGAYAQVMVGVDWTGGGQDGASRTAVAAAALAPDGKVDIIYGRKYPPGSDPLDEARDILRVATKLRARAIAHDYNGVGAAREDLVRTFGWELFMPMVPSDSPGQLVIDYRQSVGARSRGFYTISKPRSFQFLCLALRKGFIRTFDYDWKSDADPGLLRDFMQLVEIIIEGALGDRYRVHKADETVSDDFAQAANFACWGLWHSTESRPQLV